MTAVDCQYHWYPPAYFEAQLRRDDYPRARRAGDGFIYELTPDAGIPIGLAHTDLERGLATAAEAGVGTVVSSPAALGVDSLPADEARELALLLNEEQAAAQARHPGRFYGLATLPLQGATGAIEVLDDAVQRLGLSGVYLHSNVAGEPLDSPRLRPVLARVHELGVPIFLHPARTIFADQLADYGLEYAVGFLFDTTVAALRLVLGGVLDELDGLTVVHPHLGATVPYLAGRIDFELTQPWAAGRALRCPPSDYLRLFYTDTAARDPGAIELAKSFYGVERMLFATDYPWWPIEDALRLVRSTLTEGEAAAVLSGNARRLLGLASEEATISSSG